jgi:serine/threonine-protein kinase RsbW
MVEKDYQLKIASAPENIVLLETFIDQVKDAENVGDDVYGNIIISMTEAVNNAIIHGNECDANKVVTVSYRREGNKLKFTVSDTGSGFDFNNLPDPTDPENLEKLTGRGVFLMSQLSDLLVFSDSGSTVEMHFKI